MLYDRNHPENFVQPIPKVLSTNQFKKDVVRGFKVENERYLNGHVTSNTLINQGLIKTLDTGTLEVSTFERSKNQVLFDSQGYFSSVQD